MENTQQSSGSTLAATSRKVKVATHTKTRYYILAMIFIITALNYGDRATLSMAAAPMSQDLGISSITMGYIFSAFAWAYVIGQLPGGWLLDKFGARRVYFWSIFLWSIFTIAIGFVHFLGDTGVVISALFLLRFLVGLAESPAFPGNSTITAAWFPTKERGTAAAIFNASSYFSTVIFAPLMGWLVGTMSWQSIFWVMGSLGIILSLVWLKVIYSPKQHPTVNPEELAYLEAEGALTDMGENNTQRKKTTWAEVKQILSSRMMLGIFFGQYCVNCLTYFFLTWFPVYLVKERHLSILKAGFAAVAPALCGFIGGILGGIISDRLIRMGYSLTLARKLPIVLGFLLSTSIVVCNYVDSQTAIIFFMSLSFFGKGVGSLGWAVMSDVAPKQMVGLSGGMMNAFGNTAGIVTPIVIGYILATTNSFNLALVYVGIHAIVAIICYTLIVGKIQRFELRSVSK